MSISSSLSCHIDQQYFNRVRGPMNFRFIFLIVAAAIVCGCSGSEFDLGDVQGVVTLDGKPESGVIVNFRQRDGLRASGGTSGEGGKYRLIFNPQHAGALVGENRVLILAEEGMVKKLGFSKPTLLVKRVQVERGNNKIDLELRDFEPVEK